VDPPFRWADARAHAHLFAKLARGVALWREEQESVPPSPEPVDVHLEELPALPLEALPARPGSSSGPFLSPGVSAHPHPSLAAASAPFSS